MGELCLLGYPIMTKFQFGINLATRVAVYFISAYQARKVQKIYPSKGESTPAIREMKVEQNGRDGRKKCFPTFLLQ